ncbi:hypothetical protein SAMN06265365_101655 [Tistlia consotensis]|uniref:Uncharacterized protein n=1 Tax=Tistlia consotensis USBA 355 TaxID=560819 RepID=A0A1Y6B768_9PROT|nr:hypothetical protein SAMN05428998_101654 [Tistlia consotensis USBA 355]SNR29141.1 hypothetical protein SAMN06265365_101655 [Tistlia consotensis]
MAKHQGVVGRGEPVKRDEERFKFLFTNGRPSIPEGYSAPLETRTIRVLIGERKRQKVAATS